MTDRVGMACGTSLEFWEKAYQLASPFGTFGDAAAFSTKPLSHRYSEPLDYRMEALMAENDQDRELSRDLAVYQRLSGRYQSHVTIMWQAPALGPRPFQDRFRGLNHDPWRVLRCDHERRAGRGKVTKLR